MATPKSIGLPDNLFCRPFAVGLRGDRVFDLVRDQPAALAHRLEKHTLSAAFLSPIDYARNASEYLIIPDVAVSSPERNNSVVMYFREGVAMVRTLAVPVTSASDIILAKILLSERFDINPQFVPVSGSVDDMLRKADAALLAGDDALRAADSPRMALDLVEEWTAMTDLPYVHGIWVGLETALSKVEWRAIAAAGRRGREVLTNADTETSTLLDAFSFDMTDDVQEGVREFLRYAYYHGILPDVPDLRFYGSDDSYPVDPALN